jgi:cytochrome c oxidase subunit 2
MEGIIRFHNYLLFFQVFIGMFVCLMLVQIILKFNADKNTTVEKFSHSNLLEITWTLLPAFLLLVIGVPSFSLLYATDETVETDLIVKIIGHQWYWEYEVDHSKGTFTYGLDCYMTDTDSLRPGQLRLLETDSRLALPLRMHVQLLVTSADVLHSWYVPSFGVKIDACPGRLTLGHLYIKRMGVYYGQCSEICGINHGFMPIVVSALPASFYYGMMFRAFSKFNN